MLALYHGANSVCSIKVRIVLKEKNLEWESRHVDLPKGEQFTPTYLAINPRAIVPVLNHDGILIYESSVICEYLDALSKYNQLLPKSSYDKAKTHVWGIYCLEYHDSVNTLTFSSYQRKMLLDKTPQELVARWAAMPDQIRAHKLKDLVERGASSNYVYVALERLARMCADVEAALGENSWLISDNYSLADALLTAYFYRIECLGLNILWERRYPKTTSWYAQVKARESFSTATAPWLDEEAVRKIGKVGKETFLAHTKFTDFL
jgi:glutathione S-transferase